MIGCGSVVVVRPRIVVVNSGCISLESIEELLVEEAAVVVVNGKEAVELVMLPLNKQEQFE